MAVENRGSRNQINFTGNLSNEGDVVPPWISAKAFFFNRTQIPAESASDHCENIFEFSENMELCRCKRLRLEERHQALI